MQEQQPRVSTENPWGSPTRKSNILFKFFKDKETGKDRKILGFRCLAAACLIAALIFLRTNRSNSALAVAAPVGAWFLCYSFLFLAMRFWKPRFRSVTYRVQTGIDMMFFAVIVGLTGGYQGRLWPLFIPAGIFAAVNMGPSEGLSMALVTGFLYWWGAHWIASGAGSFGPWPVAAWHSALIVLPAIICSQAANKRKLKIESFRRQIDFTREKFEDLENIHSEVLLDRESLKSQAERYLLEVRRREFLFHLIKDLNERMSLEEILPHTLGFFPKSLADSEIALVIFVDDGCLAYRRRLVAGNVSIEKFPVSRSHPLITHVMDMDEPRRIDVRNMNEDVEMRKLALDRGFDSMWVEPMVSRKKIVGILVILNAGGRQFTAREKGEVSFLVYQAATAIENTLLNAKLESLASTDGLTGLYNHRVFQESLTREIHRAVRYGHEVGLALFDIDHFKNVNDGFGHQAGDEVLVELARRITANIRQEDTAARYGGEEFALILPETSLKGTVTIVERLRKIIGSKPFYCSCINESLKVTISGGVAVYPRDADSPSKLIGCSDQALYAAKESGRNRIVVFGDIPPRT